jgi:hypothetical protein
MVKDSTRLILIVLLLFIAAGCNLPSRQQANLEKTAQAQTALATQNTGQSTDISPSETPAPTPNANILPSPTPPPERADFVTDVNYPDGALVSPGEVFTKTWRLKNTGTLTWTSDYSLAFFGGDPLGAESAPLTQQVDPGQSADFSVQLTAPKIPGHYRSFWKLRDPQGQLFGIGPLADTAFYVDIVVQAPTQTPTIAPFAVNKVVVLASPPQYSGSCPTTITIVATIDVTAAGTVQYQWVQGGSFGNLESINTNGPGELQVQTSWVTSHSGYFQLAIISPTYTLSNQAQYTVNCQ